MYAAIDAAIDGSSATFEATDARYDCINAPAAAVSATFARRVGQFGTLDLSSGGTMKQDEWRQADALGRVQAFPDANADAVEPLDSYARLDGLTAQKPTTFTHPLGGALSR